MIKALLLIFEPVRTWDNIALKRRSLPYVLLLNVLPLLLVTGYAEWYSLVDWGRWRPLLEKVGAVSPHQAGCYVGGQFLLSLVVVFLTARIVQTVNQSFHGRSTFTEAFTLVAYALSPMFALRFLDMLPKLNEWVSYLIGALFMLATLYNGLPRMLKTDAPNAFGLYCLSVLIMAGITGIARFCALALLEGKLPF